MRRRRIRGPHPGGAFVGLFFVMMGLAFLLGNLGYFQLREFFRSFWPLIFILMGVSLLLRRHDDYGARNAAFIWIFVVGVFLLNMNVFNFGFRSIFPAFFILMGGLSRCAALGVAKYEHAPRT